MHNFCGIIKELGEILEIIIKISSKGRVLGISLP